jgi:hypothetical protein
MSIIKLVGGMLAAGLAALLALLYISALLMGFPGGVRLPLPGPLTAFILGALLYAGVSLFRDTQRRNHTAREQAESERLLKLRTEEARRGSAMRRLEELRREVVDAVRQMSGTWSSAARAVEVANASYERAKSAFEDHRSAAFYENLMASRNAQEEWKRLTARAKDQLTHYQKDVEEMAEKGTDARLDHGSPLLEVPLAPPLTGEEQCAKALAVIDVASGALFMEAERRTDWVMIRLQMEGNKIAKDHYEASLKHFEEAGEFFRSTGRFQERVTEQLADLQETGTLAARALVELGNKVSSLDEGVKATVEQAQLAREDFQRHSESLTRTAKNVHAILHDIHSKTLPDSLMNRYQRHSHQ